MKSRGLIAEAAVVALLIVTLAIQVIRNAIRAETRKQALTELSTLGHFLAPHLRHSRRQTDIPPGRRPVNDALSIESAASDVCVLFERPYKTRTRRSSRCLA